VCYIYVCSFDDHVHFNKVGYEKLAKSILRTIEGAQRQLKQDTSRNKKQNVNAENESEDGEKIQKDDLMLGKGQEKIQRKSKPKGTSLADALKEKQMRKQKSSHEKQTQLK